MKNFLLTGGANLFSKLNGSPMARDSRLRRAFFQVLALLYKTFPERRIHVRTGERLRFLVIPTYAQVAGFFVIILTFSWVSFSSYMVVEHGQIVALKEAQIAGARNAYEELLGEITEYQKKFTVITKDLEQNHNLMLSLVERNTVLRKNLSTVQSRLSETENDRVNIAQARQQLKDDLSKLKENMQQMTSKNYLLRDNLETVETDLFQVISQRDKALRKTAVLESTVGNLNNRLTNLEQSQEEAVQNMFVRTESQIQNAEKVLKRTGIKLANLFEAGKLNHKVARGGPFIPVNSNMPPGHKLKADLENLDTSLSKLEGLQKLLKKVPLVSPLNTYYITSSFGKRRDPINNRWAAHYGVDLGSSKRAPIYSTAPGKVIFAGWKGRYGRLIVISHGAGLKTRYGHLSKILVKRGQKVSFLHKIGLLGNSGRSTGPHLHYEVLFKGKPKNPIKFIKAGRYVFKE